MIQSLQHTWAQLPRSVQILGGIGVIIAVPFILGAIEDITNFGLITSVNRALIFVSLALGLNVVVGWAGLLNLGCAAFFAIGAYMFGILTWPNHGIEMSFFLAIWICTAVAAVFGVLVGAPTLRLRGDYLAIVTLAFGEIIPILVRNLDEVTIRIGDWVLLEDLNITNGTQGMNPLGKPEFTWIESGLGLESGSLAVGFDPKFWYFVIVITTALILLVSQRLNDSRIGRAWMAIREDQTAADFMGVDPIQSKLMAFAIGASFSGLAGAVFASMIQFISYEMFRFQVSIFLLIIVILSGMGNVYGVLVGGLLISTFDTIMLAQVLPQVPLLQDIDIQSLRWVFFGFALVAVMIFRPQGLFPVQVRSKPSPRVDPGSELDPELAAATERE